MKLITNTQSNVTIQLHMVIPTPNTHLPWRTYVMCEYNVREIKTTPCNKIRRSVNAKSRKDFFVLYPDVPGDINDWFQ